MKENLTPKKKIESSGKSKDTGPTVEELQRNYFQISKEYDHPDLFYQPKNEVRSILRSIDDATKIKRRLRGAGKSLLVGTPLAALGAAAGLSAYLAGSEVQRKEPIFDKSAANFERIVSPDGKMQAFRVKQVIQAPFNLAQLSQAQLDKMKAQIIAAGIHLPDGTIDVETIRQNALGDLLDQAAGINEWTGVPKDIIEGLGLGAERSLQLKDGRIAKISMRGTSSPENRNAAVDLDKATPQNLNLAKARAAVGEAALKRIFPPGVQIEQMQARVATMQPHEIAEFKHIAQAAHMDPNVLVSQYNKDPASVPASARSFMDKYFGQARGVEVEYVIHVPAGMKDTNWQPDWMKGGMITGAGTLGMLALWMSLAYARSRRRRTPRSPEENPQSFSSSGAYVDRGPERTRSYGHARTGGPEPSQAEKDLANRLHKEIDRMEGKVYPYFDDVITVKTAAGHSARLRIYDALRLAQTDAMQVNLRLGE